jgi:hypothetical protein
MVRVTRKAHRPYCGAKTRRGSPCQARALWDHEKDSAKNGRCRLHGGLSTGPTSPEGRQRSLEALHRGRKAWLARLKAGLG